MLKRLVLTILICSAANIAACRNTISNNTNETYKIAEIRQENKDLKKQLFLPDEYLNDEQKAHTLKPGEEVSFGGHYLPTFAIFKQYPDNKWHSLLIVKQNECGPRGPENKYLLLTDLLKCKLPDDYNPVYTFVRRKIAQELTAESKNGHELGIVTNPYQELQNILDDTAQKLHELMSGVIEKCSACMPLKTNDASDLPANDADNESSGSNPADLSDKQKDVMEGEDGKTCGACAA